MGIQHGDVFTDGAHREPRHGLSNCPNELADILSTDFAVPNVASDLTSDHEEPLGAHGIALVAFAHCPITFSIVIPYRDIPEPPHYPSRRGVDSDGCNRVFSGPRLRHDGSPARQRSFVERPSVQEHCGRCDGAIHRSVKHNNCVRDASSSGS